MIFSQRLKELRIQSNLTQKQLAEKLKYSQSIVCDWEKGIKEPSASAVVTIAELFSVTVDYLLGCEDNYTEQGNVEQGRPLYTQEEMRLIVAFRQMSFGKRKALFSMLDIELPDIAKMPVDKK